MSSLTRRLGRRISSTGSELLSDRLKNLDAYPKTLEDFRVKTYTGAAISVLSGLLMLVLFLGELNLYLTTKTHDELFVDTGADDKLRINIDITMHAMQCSYANVDVLDVTGQHQFNVQGTILKQRLDLEGTVIDEEYAKLHGADGHGGAGGAGEAAAQQKAVAPVLPPDYCGDCYGAAVTQGQCCNTCKDVIEAYKFRKWAITDYDRFEQCKREGFDDSMDKEGCRLTGYVEVRKGAGNFHIAPGKSVQFMDAHIHDLDGSATAHIHSTHTINSVSFGPQYPGMINLLDGIHYPKEGAPQAHNYYVKIVPTVYVPLSGPEVRTNQYSYTHHSRELHFEQGDKGLPGVFVTYDYSPIMIRITETQRSFIHFLTSVCAIVGGVFTVASLVDAALYRSSRAIRQKLETGKQN